MSAKLLSMIPDHRVYVEPFCGSAALLFAKTFPTTIPDYIEVLNDSNELIINLFRVLQDQVLYLQFMHMVQFTLYSESEYEKALDIIDHWDEHTPLMKAWAVYVRVNMSRSGMLANWRRALTTDPSGQWVAAKGRLKVCTARLNNVSLSNTDAVTCIKQYDSKETFFYCDPPKIDGNGWPYEHAQNLIDCLNTIQGSFILSVPQWVEMGELVVPVPWECELFEDEQRWIYRKSKKVTASALGPLFK